MTAQFQSSVTVSVAGKPLGLFRTRSGGTTTASPTKYRPGGMQKQKTRPGQSETEDVTVAREWERERDADLLRLLRKLAGSATATVTDQPLDETGRPSGKPEIFTGTLMSATGGDSDAESNDGRDLTLVIQVLEVV